MYPINPSSIASPNPSSITFLNPLPISSLISPLLLPTPLKSPSPTPVPLKRLSPIELASRRDRGLCFNYDEKFHHGHKWTSRVFLLITDEDDHSFEDSMALDHPPDPPDDPNPTPTQISFHSLSGHLAHPVVILVDGGSTHNFIKEPLAKLLGMSSQAITPLSVMVGNDQHSNCDQLCEAVPVLI